MKYIIYIFLIFLFSCNAEKRALKKYVRLKKNHPEIFTRDTTWVHDTTITDRVYADTVFYYYSDTVVIKKDRLTIKYFERADSGKFISGECAPDTIYKFIPHITESVTIKEEVPLWIYIVGGALIFITLLSIRRK